jgi:hypothetical protein
VRVCVCVHLAVACDVPRTLSQGGPGENPLELASLAIALAPPIGVPPSAQVRVCVGCVCVCVLQISAAQWDLHCGARRGLFHDLRFFLPPLAARYGSCVRERARAREGRL